MPKGVVSGVPNTRTMCCDSDLSAKEGFAVNFDTADEGNVDLATNSTKFPFILLEGNDGSAKDNLVTVILSGVGVVKLGDTVLPGAALTSDGNGKWIPTTGAGECVGAIAIDGGVLNDEIAALAVQFVDGGSY
jgi:hypothetical protein